MLFTAAAFTTLLALAAAAPAPKPNRASHEDADPAITGPGVIISNQGTLDTEYCCFNNYANGNGWASPNFDNPDTCFTVCSGEKKFVPLDKSFKGRCQRGKTGLLHTWAEFQIAASDGTGAHGDISLEQGCDGPATIESTDGRTGDGAKGGFDHQIVPGAPAAATTVRPEDKQTVIAGTMGSWLGAGNAAAITYLHSVLDASKTYIVGGTGVCDVGSSNNALKITFY